MAFSPDGKSIVSCSKDHTIRIWDVTAGIMVSKLRQNGKRNAESVAFTPDGRQVVSVSRRSAPGEPDFTLWDAKTGVALWRSGEHPYSTYETFTRTGQVIAITTLDGTLKFCDTTTGKPLLTVQGYAYDRRETPRVSCCRNMKRIVSGPFKGTVTLWDVQAQTELLTLDLQDERLRSIAISPDGNLVAIAAGDDTVKLWDASTGTHLQVIEVAADSMLFTPDGRYLFTESVDFVSTPYEDSISVEPEGKIVRLWDVTTGTEAFDVGEVPVRDLSHCIAFSPDGKRIASGSHEGSFTIRDTTTGMEAMIFQEHEEEVCSLAFSPDGSRIISHSADTSARVWDVATGKGGALPFVDSWSADSSVAFSSDGKRILFLGGLTVDVYDATTGAAIYWLDERGFFTRSDGSHSNGCPLKPWNARVQSELLASRRYPESASSVTFFNYTPWRHPQKCVVARSLNGAFKLWSLDGKESVCDDAPALSLLRMAAISPDGRRLATPGRPYGTVTLQDAIDGVRLLTLGKDMDCESLSFSPDGKQILCVPGDGTVKLWNANNQSKKFTLLQHDDYVTWVAFGPDGKRIAGVQEGGMGKLWDATTSEEILSLDDRYADNITFSPDGKRMASPGESGSFRLWDMVTGDDILTFHGHDRHVESLAFTRDGARIASGSEDTTVRIWDAETGVELHKCSGHTGAVRCVGFSADGKQVVSGSEDGTARLWDTATGTEVLAFRGHSAPVHSVAFSPSGDLIVSGADGIHSTVMLWSTTTGNEVFKLGSVHSGNGNGCTGSVSFSPTGQQIVSVSYHYITIWDASSGDLVLKLWNDEGCNSNVAFSPNGNRIIYGSGMSVKILNLAAYEEQLLMNVPMRTHPPPKHQPRTWTDSTGSYSIIATFAGYNDGQVRLVVSGRDDAVVIPLEKLSEVDRKYVEELK